MLLRTWSRTLPYLSVAMGSWQLWIVAVPHIEAVALVHLPFCRLFDPVLSMESTTRLVFPSNHAILSPSAAKQAPA